MGRVFLLLACFLNFMTSASIANPQAPGLLLRCEVIKVYGKREGLADYFRPRKFDYAVKARLVNNSDTELRLASMGCSWWEFWKFSDSRLEPPGSRSLCLSNIRTAIVLGPGAVHERVLNLAFVEGSDRSLPFKVAFNAQPATVLITAQREAKSFPSGWIWSDDVRLP